MWHGAGQFSKSWETIEGRQRTASITHRRPSYRLGVDELQFLLFLKAPQIAWSLLRKVVLHEFVKMFAGYLI
jgi:hypothetical protein